MSAITIESGLSLFSLMAAAFTAGGAYFALRTVEKRQNEDREANGKAFAAIKEHVAVTMSHGSAEGDRRLVSLVEQVRSLQDAVYQLRDVVLERTANHGARIDSLESNVERATGKCDERHPLAMSRTR